MDNIAALIGQTQRPDEVRMAEALRGQQRQGDFLGMSTLQPIAQMGQSMSTRSADAAKTMGGLVRARQEREAQAAQKEADRALKAEEQEGLAQYRQDMLQAQEDARISSEEQAEQDRISEQRIAEMNNRRAIEVADRRLALTTGKAMKPPASMVKDYLAGLATIREIGTLVDLYASMNEKQKEMLNNAKGEVALEYAPSDIGTMAKRVIYPDPKVREFMTKGRALESQISKSMSGLQLTEYEIKDRKTWSPFASGGDTVDKILRMRNVVQDAQGRLGDLREIYGDYLPDYSGVHPFEAIDPKPDVNAGDEPKVTVTEADIALLDQYKDMTEEELDALIKQEETRQRQLLYADEYGGTF